MPVGIQFRILVTLLKIYFITNTIVLPRYSSINPSNLCRLCSYSFLLLFQPFIMRSFSIFLCLPHCL